MVREGEIDVSPSSSIEFLRDTDSYSYIEGHSISSEGPVRSILLFSRVPLESLHGHEIYATHQSETSVALLRIILEEFIHVHSEVKVSSQPVDQAIEAHSAYLSIGDEALLAFRHSHPVELDLNDAYYQLRTIDHDIFYVYDLGELWFKLTGLPFVFALWIARKDVIVKKRELFENFVNDLHNAHLAAKDKFQEIARISELALPPEELVEYWNGINYGLTDDCLKGLDLFHMYLGKYNLL
jgi:chorismate dehydratase